MKPQLLLFAFILSLSAFAENGQDTTFLYNSKRYKIIENDKKISVKVYTEDKEANLIYEGQFADGKKKEQWNINETILFPFPDVVIKNSRFKRRKMSPHWAGFALGYSNIADRALHINDIDGMNILAGKSTEVMFNILETIIPIHLNQLGITTGLGLNWRTFYFDNNEGLAVRNGKTEIIALPEWRNYKYTRLKTTHITIPLLLEYQPCDRNRVFLSAGIVGGVKIITTYKQEYREDGKKVKIQDRDHTYYTNPFSFDIMIQAGYKWLGIYAKYAPAGIFQSNKGPAVHAVSVGGMLHF